LVHVIAEVGVNHCGELSKARELIVAAHKAGADAVKFQTFDAEMLEPPGPRRDMLKQLQLSVSDHYTLRDDAGSYGLEFISTPFDVDSLQFLVEQLGVGTLKISSGDIDNFELLDAAGETDCDVILSTGLSTLVTIRKALEYVPDATLLHCTSAYPAPIQDANLRAMDTMRREFGRKVGLSDHTPGYVAPIMAVAMGAEVIEKHITLSRSLPGPDHLASLEPHEFREMATAVRFAEEALGDGVKTPRASEAEVMKIVAARRAFRCTM
jgi:N,N'-diacetyllegionaminate synthase